jgi:hypothetical protein
MRRQPQPARMGDALSISDEQIGRRAQLPARGKD